MKDLAVFHAKEKVCERAPLVHSITNYVTANDCANALLAIGASPLMSDEPRDVGDITRICDALVLNIGTLNEQSIKAMYAAGTSSADLGHPIVLDPVGAGASALRSKTASDLLDRLPISVIRGNMSEVKALAEGACRTRGVDVCPSDLVTEENLTESAHFACEFAVKTQALVVITGAIDVVADAQQVYAIRNGTSLQGRITGAGCMLSCMSAAYVVSNQDNPLEALVAAVVSMGLAGQFAEKRMSAQDGNGSFRTYLLDALYCMKGETMEQGARIERVG